MIRIEIEFDLDESEWQYMGVVVPEIGDKYYKAGNLIDYFERSAYAYPTFRRRKSWKDGIVWPRMLPNGYVARDWDGDVHWFNGEPRIEHEWWREGSKASDNVKLSALCLDFLPKEFWECDWKDSLCEVKHG